MHPKVFVKLKKTLSSEQKNPKKPKKPKKKQKNPKKPTGLVFFLKNPGFFQPCFLYLCFYLKFFIKFFFLVRPAGPVISSLGWILVWLWD
jgi:hypothetical protein